MLSWVSLDASVTRGIVEDHHDERERFVNRPGTRLLSIRTQLGTRLSELRTSDAVNQERHEDLRGHA